jgi:hypothetical protein
MLVPLHEAYLTVLPRRPVTAPTEKLTMELIRERGNRLRRVLRKPAILDLDAPWSYLLHLLNFLACFLLPLLFLPQVLLVLLLANGLLEHQRGDDYAHVVIWNDQIEKRPAVLKRMASTRQKLEGLQGGLGKVASVVETGRNIHNFKDPRVSKYLFCLLGALSLLVSLVLALIRLDVLIFLVGEAVLFLLVRYSGVKAVQDDEAESHDPNTQAAKVNDGDSAGGIEQEEIDYYSEAVDFAQLTWLGKARRAILCLLLRVPTSVDCEHRHIALSQRIEGNKRHTRDSRIRSNSTQQPSRSELESE